MTFCLYEDWLHCRFEEPHHAKRNVDCNPHSGKYNCHPNIGPATTADDVFNAYRSHLLRALAKPCT